MVEGGIGRRSDMKHIPFGDSDPDKIIVSLCEFKDELYCATQKGVYILNKKEFVKLKLVEKQNG